MQHEERAAEGYGVYESVGRSLGEDRFAPVKQPSVTVTTKPVLLGSRLHVQTRYASGVRSRIPLRMPQELTGRVLTLNSTMPGLSIPGAPQLGFVESGGLWRLDEQAEPILSAVLGAQSFVEGPGANDPKTGQTVFMVGQTSGDAMTTVRGFIQAGYAALLEKASPATGILQWVFTATPSIVLARAAGPGATHALVDDEPSAVVAAAAALASGGGGGQLPGTIIGPDGGTVVGPGESSTPKWVVPALIGAGVLAVGAIVYAGRKR